jgi:hypothetical protein
MCTDTPTATCAVVLEGVADIAKPNKTPQSSLALSFIVSLLGFLAPLHQVFREESQDHPLPYGSILGYTTVSRSSTSEQKFLSNTLHSRTGTSTRVLSCY